MTIKTILAAAATILIGSAASAVTVPDFSFETPVTGSYVYNPSVAGVTFNAGSGVQRNGSAWGFANAPDGSQTGFIQSSTNVIGSIAFALSDLVMGQRYVVTVALSARPGYALDPLTVSLGGSTIGAFTASQPVWSDFTTSEFVAGSTAASLVFTGSTTTTGDNDVGLDRVRVAAVPEAGTWAMMLVGFGAVGFATRRHRRTAVSFG